MRLKSVFVSQYKNLKNFTLGFDGASFIDVFVGKNGSGKSNLFEAPIEIFRHIYEHHNEKGDTEQALLSLAAKVPFDDRYNQAALPRYSIRAEVSREEN